MSARVPPEQAEPARARMLELFPDGFEETAGPGFLELAAYTDEAGEERLAGSFRSVASVPISQDWSERWRDFHRPVEAGPFWVGPPWEPAPAGRRAIVIDPGRAFGTGAHPTSRLCLELLAAGPAGSLLDVGCGSGVLAIAGAKLGCAPVVAIDVDPQAVAATRVNAARNGVTIEARQMDALMGPLPAVEVAVANLTRQQIEALAPCLDASRLIASGYLEGDTPTLAGFDRGDGRTLEGWAADVFERVA